MHADPQIMADLGGAFSRTKSDAKFDRYALGFQSYGFCRWAIEDADGTFLGYAGMMRSGADHPLGAHTDIGWRLVRDAWGHGYATEAAAAALQDGFLRAGLTEIFAYTAPDNLHSQEVMARLGLIREPARDFILNETGWHGLVWTARRTD